MLWEWIIFKQYWVMMTNLMTILIFIDNIQSILIYNQWLLITNVEFFILITFNQYWWPLWRLKTHAASVQTLNCHQSWPWWSSWSSPLSPSSSLSPDTIIITITITITRLYHHHHHQHHHLSIIFCVDACHQQEGGGGESKWRRGLADFFFKNHVTLGKIHSKFMRFF